MRYPSRWLILAVLLVSGLYVPGRRADAAPSGCLAEAETAVRALLATQAEAWNRGDLAAFTAVYAEDASFLGPTGLTQGRRAVLERYRKRYPNKKAMGTLRLDVVEIRPVAADPASPTCRALGASVAARWQLTYPDSGSTAPPTPKTAQGLTLLVLHRHGETWEIVEDASM